MLNLGIGAVGAVSTFTYLAYIYTKSQSVFVTSIAHIAMNNAAISISYFATAERQLLANVGLTLSTLLVVALLHYRKELSIFAEYYDLSH